MRLTKRGWYSMTGCTADRDRSGSSGAGQSPERKYTKYALYETSHVVCLS